MPAPKHPIVIGVKSSTSISEGEFIKVTNLTSGGTLRGPVDSSGEVLLTPPPDFGFTWANGDKVSVEVNGRLIGSGVTTIAKGGANFEVTTAADASSPAVDL